MRSLIVYYSRTGNTREIAHLIATAVDGASMEHIEARNRRPYWKWLLWSCVPNSRVPIEPIDIDVSNYDTVFIGTPKWTLSCPPVTEFLERVDLAGTNVGLFMTYGGFDEERYLRQLVTKLAAQDATVVATLRVKGDAIGTPTTTRQVEQFCDVVLGATS